MRKINADSVEIEEETFISKEIKAKESSNHFYRQCEFNVLYFIQFYNMQYLLYLSFYSIKTTLYDINGLVTLACAFWCNSVGIQILRMI